MGLAGHVSGKREVMGVGDGRWGRRRRRRRERGKGSGEKTERGLTR